MNRPLRLGTRGSDLALAQTRIVARLLHEHSGAASEEVVITTSGDRASAANPTGSATSAGAFVTEIEEALCRGDIDLAVHSCKDMATASAPGLVIAATPPREDPRDTLACASAQVRERLAAALDEGREAPDLAVGTSSPRREAQLRDALGCGIAPVRGNVPTRLSRLSQSDPEGVDALCLAAAGLARLAIEPPHTLVLPIETFPTAPGQGAIAIQAREGTDAAALAARISHPPTMEAVLAERAFLRHIDAGCDTAAAATAVVGVVGDGPGVQLHVQYFTEDGRRFEARRSGRAAHDVGDAAGEELLAWLRSG